MTLDAHPAQVHIRSLLTQLLERGDIVTDHIVPWGIEPIDSKDDKSKLRQRLGVAIIDARKDALRPVHPRDHRVLPVWVEIVRFVQNPVDVALSIGGVERELLRWT